MTIENDEARGESGGPNRLARAAAGLATVALVVAAAVVMARPWTGRNAGVNVPVARYINLHEGQSALFRKTVPGGPDAWTSTNVHVLPGLLARTALPQEFRLAVGSLVDPDGNASTREQSDRLERLAVVRNTVTTLDDEGGVSTFTSISVLAPDGFRLLGYEDDGGGAGAIRFTPPPLSLPPDPELGSTWTSEGTFSGIDFTWVGEVVDAGPKQTAVGDFDDCLTVETTFTAADTETVTLQDYCAGRGGVRAEEFDPASVSELVASDVDGAPEASDMPPVDVVDDSDFGEAASWEFTRLGDLGAGSLVDHAAITPVFVPSDPPLVLTSREGETALIARAAGGDSLGAEVWRFHTGGVVYGQPVFDAERGRIYFGSSDKSVYALDPRGVFLWAAPTDDVVSASPAVAGDIVVVTSEDHHVYGLDAATGERRWRASIDSASSASPAVVGDVVAVAGDEGVVHGFAAATGDESWSYDAGARVEADILATADGFIVASAAGSLVALDTDGAARWAVDAADELESAAAAIDDTVAVVDGEGDLVGFDLADGQRRWVVAGRGFVGPPAAAGTGFAVARENGAIDQIGADGTSLASWDGADEFRLGASAGGGAVWLLDETAGLWRLGAPVAGEAAAVDLAFLAITAVDPFDGGAAVTTPVAWRDEAVVLTTGNSVYRVDAAGTGTLIAPSVTEGAAVAAPIVVDDRIIVVTGLDGAAGTAVAVDLVTGQTLWGYDYESFAAQSAVAADGIVVLATGTDDEWMLHALDVATGAVVWQATTPGFVVNETPITPPGAIVADGVVFGGNPLTAYDLDTGAVVWTSEFDNASGRPVLLDGGTALAVAGVSADGNEGRLAVLDADDGSIVWDVDGLDALLPPTGALVLVDDVLAFVSIDNRLMAFDAATGAEQWDVALPTGALGRASAIDGRLWIALVDTRVLVVDAASGEVVGAFSGLGSEGELSAAQEPVLIGDAVVVAAGIAVIGLRVALR